MKDKIFAKETGIHTFILGDDGDGNLVLKKILLNWELDSFGSGQALVQISTKFDLP
jgi:hypothetical protein